MLKKPKKKFKKKTLGVTVLLLTVTLLLISMLLILFAAQYSALQQKITANLYRNQQAFEAAQAGLEVAIPYFQTNYTTIESQARKGFLKPYQNSSTQNVALANGSQYTFVYTNPTKNDYNLITITSTGINADGSSTRVISQQIQAYSSGIPTPTISSTTQGSVTLSGTSSITNTQTNSNIKAGNSVSISNSARTVTSSGTTSNSSALGSDVAQNNSDLSSLSTDNFFQSIFGASQVTVQNNADRSYSNVSNHTYNSNLNGTTGSIIWIDQLGGLATINSSTVIGSTSKPVILIVNGNLLLSGFATIYGLVFVLNPSTTVIINQNAIINGVIASTGDISFQGASALSYNTTVLNNLPTVNNAVNYAKVPASWKDF